MAKNNRLTKVEEEIMQYIWELSPTTVSNIIEQMSEPRPPHSTISSIVRILEKKGFVTHVAYGRTHVYQPLIEKDDYLKGSLRRLVTKYFDDSPKALVSFLLEKEDLSLHEMQDILNELKKDGDD